VLAGVLLQAAIAETLLAVVGYTTHRPEQIAADLLLIAAFFFAAVRLSRYPSHDAARRAKANVPCQEPWRGTRVFWPGGPFAATAKRVVTFQESAAVVLLQRGGCFGAVRQARSS
jgi:hypothetical protein